MKSRRFLIVGFLLAMILASGVWFVSRNSGAITGRRNYGQSPVANTFLFLNIIEDGINAEASFNKRLPCDLSVLPTNISTETMYSFLVYTNEPYYDNYARGTRQKFPDAWHNEMHFRVDRNSSTSTNSKTISLKVIVWSNGPNEKDESGGGDDMTREFNIELPVTAIKEVSH
jgi:hypothetical protein